MNVLSLCHVKRSAQTNASRIYSNMNSNLQGAQNVFCRVFKRSFFHTVKWIYIISLIAFPYDIHLTNELQGQNNCASYILFISIFSGRNRKYVVQFYIANYIFNSKINDSGQCIISTVNYVSGNPVISDSFACSISAVD